MNPSIYPVLIFSLAGLIDTWIKEFEKCVDDTNEWVSIVMLVGHSQSGKGREVSNMVKVLMGRMTSNGYVKLHPNQSCLLVVTSSRSYSMHVSKDLRIESPHRRGIPPQYDDLSYWGMILRDEAHLEKAPSSSAMTLINGIRKDQHYKTPVWIYSGTVFEISPEDLVGMVEVLETEEWESDETLRFCTSKEVRRLAKDFKKGASSLSAVAKEDIVMGSSKLLS